LCCVSDDDVGGLGDGDVGLVGLMVMMLVWLF
jgi:hypothetical protein